MSVQEILEEARALSVDEQKELIKLLIDVVTEPPGETKKRSIREFRGLGAHLYDGTDAQAYVNQIRSEWDDCP